MKNILVIGATSAIAQACAKKWAAAGCRLFLVARNPQKLDPVAEDLIVRGAEVYQHVLDINQLEQHPEMFSVCHEKLGDVDIALIAHGTLPDQSACESNVGLAVHEFTNNGLNVIALLTELANRMELQRKGTIAVISSVAGDRGRQSNYVYGAAKSAVSAFCSGLRARLFKSGVHVLTIKPGFVDTPMTGSLTLPGVLVVSADRVSTDILRAIERKQDVLYTPWFWRWIMLLIIHLPTVLFKRMSL